MFSLRLVYSAITVIYNSYRTSSQFGSSQSKLTVLYSYLLFIIYVVILTWTSPVGVMLKNVIKTWCDCNLLCFNVSKTKMLSYKETLQHFVHNNLTINVVDWGGNHVNFLNSRLSPVWITPPLRPSSFGYWLCE